MLTLFIYILLYTLFIYIHNPYRYINIKNASISSCGALGYVYIALGFSQLIILVMQAEIYYLIC